MCSGFQHFVLIILISAGHCGTSTLKIDLEPMVIVEYPAQDVSFPCTYPGRNTSEPVNIRWTEKHKHGGFVLEKSTAGKVFSGHKYKTTARFGNGCSLKLTNYNFKPYSVHTYVVRVDTFNTPQTYSATTKLVKRGKAPITALPDCSTTVPPITRNESKSNEHSANNNGMWTVVAVIVAFIIGCCCTMCISKKCKPVVKRKSSWEPN